MSPSHRPLCLALLLSIAPTLLATPCAAGDPAMAEELFQQGRKAMDEKRFAQACDLFAASHRQEAKLGTLLNLALCHEQQGRSATAWAEFSRAETEAKRAGDDGRAAFAREHIDALKPTLSRVVFRIAEQVPGMLLQVDGNDIEAGLAGVGLPFDPGNHAVRVEAPGKEPWETTIDVPAGPNPKPLEVPVPALTASAPPPQPVVPLTPAPVVVVPPPVGPAVEPSGGLPTAAWVSFGVAGAGVLVGAITGGISLSEAGRLKDECVNGVCVGDLEDDRQAANALANVSNISFAVAGVGALIGVVVLLVDGRDARSSSASGSSRTTPPQAQLQFVPIGGDQAGLRVSF